MPKREPTNLLRRALRLQQNDRHPLYLFSLTAENLSRVADISRVSRDDAGKLIGYQRPEVKKHVQDIVEYLDSEHILFPNSIILALGSGTKFKESRGPKVNDDRCTTPGTLEIQLRDRGGARPAWIVDGQQRALALSMTRRKDLVVPVTAFVADEVELQRDQFLRINNSKPLPRGLITELLPEVSAPLPAKLSARRVPAELCELLNRREDSPFVGLIKRASSNANQRRNAVVTDTSIIKMLQESLTSPSGCLFPYRNLGTGEIESDKIWLLLTSYWTAVRNTFPKAWGKPPTKSRLMHGAGIIAMGRLMDRVMSSVNPLQRDLVSFVEYELQTISPVCHWTSGNWDELGGLPWNELQNVPRHISLLSSLLIRSYIQASNSG